jgi:hypothetical protein
MVPLFLQTTPAILIPEETGVLNIPVLKNVPGYTPGPASFKSLRVVGVNCQLHLIGSLIMTPH